VDVVDIVDTVDIVDIGDTVDIVDIVDTVDTLDTVHIVDKGIQPRCYWGSVPYGAPGHTCEREPLLGCQ